MLKKKNLRPLADSVVVRSVLSILLALLVASIFILLVGKSPVLAFSSLAKGAFGNGRAVANTINKAVPLIFTGLAAAFAFKSGMLNIGIEGQLHMGALLSIVSTEYAAWCTSVSGNPVVYPWRYCRWHDVGSIDWHFERAF